MATRRRRPPPPPAPRAPRLPTLRLSPVRSAGSVELDDATTRAGLPVDVPYVRWDRFLEDFQWRQGEHLTTIGPTGSGKTVLNRELLRFRSYVVVLGVKNRDPELYGPFERMGYELVHRFEPEPPEEVDQARVLFVPQTSKHGSDARKDKAAKFRLVLNEIQDVGYWCVYCDDVMYMADQLRLTVELEELWILGRSEGVSVVASSQEPVNIPVMAYGMATHLFLFTNKDRYRARRMAELTGVNREVAEKVILELPPHEFLYINKNTGKMLRSKVIPR